MDPNLARELVAPSAADKAALAKHIFDEFVASRPSRQQLKKFMTERATAYFGQHSNVPRKERRDAAKKLGRQMQKKALNGELE